MAWLSRVAHEIGKGFHLLQGDGPFSEAFTEAEVADVGAPSTRLEQTVERGRSPAYARGVRRDAARARRPRLTP